MQKTIYDIIVIGAGPTGLFSTFYASYMKLNCLCIELTNNIGGQLTNLYPNKYIYDFPGHEKIKAKDLILILENQIKMKNYEIILNTSIQNYKFDSNLNSYILYDQNNNQYYAKNIIITIGVGSFEPNKIPNFEHTHEYENTHYNLKSGIDYNKKNIVVLGGGDSAIDIAHQLKSEFNAQVHLIHRGEELRATSFDLDYLREIGIQIYLNTHIIECLPNQCSFKNLETNFSINYDYLIVQYGLKPLSSPIHSWNDIAIENKKILVDENYQTNIKNIFAAGDCIKDPSRVNTIISGISEATIIINKIKKSINN